MGKVTMQDIADALGISRVSVWKVFNEQAGVSETLKNNVVEMAAKLGYSGLGSSKLVLEESLKTNKTISLVVSRPDSASFWTDIIHSLAKELSIHDVNLMYTYIPGSYSSGFQLPSVLTNGNIDGIITLNIYDKDIMRRINNLSIPKVFLDTVPFMNDNPLQYDLILIEGRKIFAEMVDDVVDKGCSKIGFIGDISYARTNFERYQGFIDGLDKNRIPHDTSLCFTETIGIFNYQTRIFEFLDSLKEMPDAFMCVSDYVAQFVCMYITEHPDRFKHPIILTGFDGSKEYVNVADKITTATVRTRQLGTRLAYQILYRLQHPNAPYETIYIHPELSLSKSCFP